MSSQVTGVGVSNEGEFGANEWLVDELYEQFKIDKNSVDKAWWPILEAYHPVDTDGGTAPRRPRRAPAPRGSRPAAAPPRAGRRAAGRDGAPPGHRADPGRSARSRWRARPPGRPSPPADPGAGADVALPSAGEAEPRRTRSPSCAGMPKTLAANMDESLTRPDRDERAHRARRS